jgi:hypothetical protein
MKIYKLTSISPNSNDVNTGNRTEVDETTWMAKILEAVSRERGCDAQRM